MNFFEKQLITQVSHSPNLKPLQIFYQISRLKSKDRLFIFYYAFFIKCVIIMNKNKVNSSYEISISIPKCFLLSLRMGLEFIANRYKYLFFTISFFLFNIQIYYLYTTFTNLLFMTTLLWRSWQGCAVCLRDIRVLLQCNRIIAAAALQLKGALIYP